MSSLRLLAWLSVGTTYGLLVLGGVVRITGSGMGCGDDWPRCHGRWIPPLDDLPTLIEWSHRLAALGVSVLVVAVAVAALRSRRAVRPALIAVGLLGAQVLLGAITVWLELPPAAVTLHLGTAMALLAALLISALQIGSPHLSGRPASLLRRLPVVAALALGATAVLLGGLTASLDAGTACQGFPLCSGRLWPAASSGLPQIHWLHRLAGYALFAHLLGMAYGAARAARRPGPDRMRPAAWSAFALAALQVVVAAVMVTTALPLTWRVMHVALGTAVWAALVWLAWEASTSPRVPA